MQFSGVRSFLTRRNEPRILWVLEGPDLRWAWRWSPSVRRAVEKLSREKRIKGKLGETFVFPSDSGWLILAGVGKREEFQLDSLRQAAAAAARQALAIAAETLAVGLAPVEGADAGEVAQAITEGIALGTYRYQELKVKSLTPEEKRTVRSVTIAVEENRLLPAVLQGLRRGRSIAEAVCWARDLANRPSNRLTPTQLAREAQAASRRFGFRCRVLEPPALKRLGMNALLGVSRGSQEPARFIILEYRGRRAGRSQPLVFVGKGITFDSGGISIKPSAKMEEMKFDMCGGAAVLGALRAVAALRMPVHVVGLVPVAENLPGGSAQKPGDVVRAYTGKTIEVINTDAEGRLILADALGYAQRFKPEGIVDLATLTGACVVALGSHAMGLMGNHAGLVSRVKEAAEYTAERTWELPLWPEYTKAIQSAVADVQNVGDGKAGTITAGCFLKEFVGKTPWVHLDIAGVAWEGPKLYHQPKGGTGAGVRLLVELARRWKPGGLKRISKSKGPGPGSGV